MSMANKLFSMMEKMYGDYAKVNPDDVVVGTIYVSINAYSETNTRSYYQVMKRTPKSVVLARMSDNSRSRFRNTPSYYDDSTPTSVAPNAKTFTRRLMPNGCVQITPYELAYVYEIPSGVER